MRTRTRSHEREVDEPPSQFTDGATKVMGKIAEWTGQRSNEIRKKAEELTRADGVSDDE